MSEAWLRRFVEESNKIEGIHGVAPHELEAHEQLLAKRELKILDLSYFVSQIAEGHVLRNIKGLNVRVGDHIAPEGGWIVPSTLDTILFGLNSTTPYQTHLAYENLHPFTDGNGRSGRALWLWQHLNTTFGMPGRVKGLGFLHTFYYETLRESDERYHSANQHVRR